MDAYLRDANINHLTVLHSDIQGAEEEMLEGALGTLRNRRVDYLFISTHGQGKHLRVLSFLQENGYRVEVSADVRNETTSHDGFILAVRPDLESVFSDWSPLGRVDILKSGPRGLVNSLRSRL